MKTLSDFDAVRFAPRTQKEKLAFAAAERRAAIAAYGLPPEPEGCAYADRYAGTTGEFWRWAAEKR